MKNPTKQKATKAFRDLGLIFYDDLEFKAMSLPRVGAGLLTIVVLISWAADQFGGLRYEHFDALAGICGGIWTAYAFNKWTKKGGASWHGSAEDARDPRE